MGDLRDLASLTFKDEYEISIHRSKDHYPTIPKLGLMQAPKVPLTVTGPIVFDDEVVVQPKTTSYIITPKVSRQNITPEAKPTRRKGNQSYNPERVKMKGPESYSDEELRYWYKQINNATVHPTLSRAKLIELHQSLRT